MTNLGKQILELVGGEKNIKTVTYCATRLRFQIHDKHNLRINDLKALKGVVGVVDADQLQIVIGIQVGDIYDELVEGTSLGKAKKGNGKEKKKVGAIFLDVVVSIFSPLLPALAGSGVLRGLVILATQVGILSKTSSTYVILTVASTAIFHFLPVLLAMTTAKKFGASPYISVLIMGALIMPDFEALMANGGVGTIVNFMSIPVVMVHYTGQVIPAICAIYAQSKLENFLKKFVPQSLKMIVIPAVSLFLMVPLTAIVFGPVGVYLGMGIADMVKWVRD
ncbi:PTS transporter subunit EIIC [Lactovum odontotermitis]